MLVIALTGGIGSGKTTVSNIFKSKNIPVIDTDIIARQVVKQGKPAYLQIITTFGENILTDEKEIDRQALRTIVFSSAQEREKLENILHPLIWNEVRSQLSLINAPYCVVVVPLLLEKKSNINEISFDRILVLDIDEKSQIERVKKRDNCEEAIVRNIINSQVTRQTRLRAADDILVNTNDITALQEKVELLHQQYMKLSG